MRWTESRFDHVIIELIEENPFAVRPVLKILRRRFTHEVPTLAVTLSDPPELLINPDFIEAHCRNEAQLKAALFHEFLHVLLGHTMRFKTMTPIQYLALDATINAIIFRQCGAEYASIFVEYYADQTGIGRLLRPQNCADRDLMDERWRAEIARTGYFGQGPVNLRRALFFQTEQSWVALYTGKLISDDVLELAESLGSGIDIGLENGKVLIGNHGTTGVPIEGALAEALDQTLRQMNGSGIWRAPHLQGSGAYEYRPMYSAADAKLDRWKAQTLKALQKALIPDARSTLVEYGETTCRLPILSSRDRRAFIRAGWSPLIPEADNASYERRPLGWANVYLDVSGSMDAEMPLVISVLNKVRKSIRMPFWAFSTVVSPARITAGRLETATTGGTSMSCVLAHVAQTKPLCAVVVTDGYIEAVNKDLLASCSGTRLTAIVTRDGDPSKLNQAGIPYVQLEACPND